MKRTLQTAQRLINERVGAVMRCSHRYQSPAWGFKSETLFTNQALEISTDLSPIEVLEAVQQIENELGRNRAAEQIEKAATGARYSSRPIDIDIIFYGSEVIREERLTLSVAGADGVVCEQCGAPICTGRFCDKCKMEMANTFAGAIQKPKPQEPQKAERDKNRMRFL